MATNKNALIRYRFLDTMLSDRHHYYSILDLYTKVNAMLEADGFKIVTRRCVETDIEDLQDAPFRAELFHVSIHPMALDESMTEKGATASHQFITAPRCI